MKRDERTLHKSEPRVPSKGAVVVACEMLGTFARNLYLRVQDYRSRKTEEFVEGVERLNRGA